MFVYLTFNVKYYILGQNSTNKSGVVCSNEQENEIVKVSDYL